MNVNNFKIRCFCYLFVSLAFFSCGKGSDNAVTPTNTPPTTTPPPTSTTPATNSTINASLVTANPTFEANNLYQFIRNNYGKKIISGVMTLNSFDETDWLLQNTGKQPAIVGLDFMHCNRGYTWYNNAQPANDAKTWWAKNGIPVFVWHWRDPSRATESFYYKNTSDHTDGTTFDVAQINDPNSAGYKAMLNDIDFVAGQFKNLQDQKVPVLFRPLHEAAGGWFWWGKNGAACKKLYQVMYDRLVNYWGLKNIIWVWTREPNDDAFYPGDAYVDIVGRDVYKDGNHTSQLSEYTALTALYSNKKIITLSETGSFPDPDNLVADKAYWSWFMPWYGNYTRDAKYNSLDLWKKAFASDYVITLDKMPSLKQ